MGRDRLAFGFLVLAVLACNLLPGIPVTPTVAPTLKPSASPSPTAIALLPTWTPSPTFTPSATDTPTDTPTVTSTPTGTPSATATPVLTSTPSDTATLVPSVTPPPTETPTSIVLPTLVPSLTSSPTLSPPSETPPPIDLGIITLTPTPTLVAQPPQPPAVETLAPTPGSFPTLPATSGAPTIESLIVSTSTSISIIGPTPTALVLGFVPTARAISGDDLRSQRTVDVSRDRKHRAEIDPNGQLFIDGQPLSAHIPRTEARVRQVRWSPDGRWLAFVLQMPGAQNEPVNSLLLIDDGLWVLDTATNTAYFVYRQIYDNPYDNPPVRLIDDILWAPDSNAILVTLRRHQGKASVLVGVGGAVASPSQYANTSARLPVRNYAGGAALPDNQGFVVTSAQPDQPPVLGVLYPDGRFEAVVDGGVLGLWMQNAARLPDGRYAFLGKMSPGGRFDGTTASLRLYVMWLGGQPIPASGILSGSVLYADWDLDVPALSVRLQNGTSYSTVILRP